MATLQELQDQLATLEAEIESVKQQKAHEAAVAEAAKTPEEKEAEMASHFQAFIDAKTAELAELKK
jgi:hypothetical protein